MFQRSRFMMWPGNWSVLAIGLAAVAVTGPADSARASLIYGVTEQNVLIKWDSASPHAIQSGIAISGMQSNEQVQGIDFRPATGQLYLVGSYSNLYSVNLNTGLATAVGGQFSTIMNGANFGFDFNPVVDRIRLVSDADQNMRLNPNDGSVAGVDSPLAYAPGDPNFPVNPNVVDAAYTNSFAGAATTTLYAIDTGLDRLVTIGSLNGTPNSPNGGQLFTVGSLGIDVAEDGGFDILSSVVAGESDIAYAALRRADQSVSKFYSINLITGAATLIGEIGGGINIRAMAVAPVPAPGPLALLACAAFVFTARRRRA